MSGLLDADGLQVAHTVEGSGPPRVLLHGASSSALEDCAQQRPLFRQSFGLYLPDARGLAATRWDAAASWTREQLMEDLCAYTNELALDTLHLAGFSMGR